MSLGQEGGETTPWGDCLNHESDVRSVGHLPGLSVVSTVIEVSMHSVINLFSLYVKHMGTSKEQDYA